ncbi:hypothetical protein AACH10_02895 [Ideonella sp. DXS22W]|uniref:Uncharacterized protein n=1 Tax=Pseudaquabacterium inlustre TaxID=2984192 RepID=A0ABU9CF94_9BURK
MPLNSARTEATPRTRTPPDLKWLLNERAALLGVADRVSERQRALALNLKQLEVELSVVAAELEAARSHAAAVAGKLHALDTTLGLMHPEVNPAAAGCVQAWAGRFGERGALTAFVQEHLRALWPEATLAAEIQRAVVAYFGLEVRTPQERRRLKSSLCTILRQLRDHHGVLERVENWRGRLPQPLWRWKSHAPSLAELQLAADAAEDEDDEEVGGERAPNPDPVGVEVACERTGGHEG